MQNGIMVGDDDEEDGELRLGAPAAGSKAGYGGSGKAGKPSKVIEDDDDDDDESEEIEDETMESEDEGVEVLDSDDDDDDDDGGVEIDVMEDDGSSRRHRTSTGSAGAAAAASAAGRSHKCPKCQHGVGPNATKCGRCKLPVGATLGPANGKNSSSVTGKGGFSGTAHKGGGVAGTKVMHSVNSSVNKRGKAAAASSTAHVVSPLTSGSGSAASSSSASSSAFKGAGAGAGASSSSSAVPQQSSGQRGRPRTIGAGAGAGSSSRGASASSAKNSSHNKQHNHHHHNSRHSRAVDESDDEDQDQADDHLPGAVLVRSTGAVTHMKTETDNGTFMHSVSKPKALPPAPVFAPLSPLDSFTMRQIDLHVRALQAETFQRRFRPLIIRLMEHSVNSDTFNSPVDPSKLGIMDYHEIVKQPMDLGTVRQKLEAGRYQQPDELAADAILTFSNAMLYNPQGHYVHGAAERLKNEFIVEYNRLTSKGDLDVKRKEAHSCGFCQGQMCRLCGDKCLRFDPPVMSCDCCMERIKRGDTYYRAPSGQRWCARCVSNAGANAEPGAILPPAALLKLASTAALEGLLKHLGVTGTVSAIAATALAAATTSTGRYGAQNAAAAVASMQQAAAAQAAAEAEAAKAAAAAARQASPAKAKLALKGKAGAAAVSAAASASVAKGAGKKQQLPLIMPVPTSAIASPKSSSPARPGHASSSAAAGSGFKHGGMGMFTPGQGGVSLVSIPAGIPGGAATGGFHPVSSLSSLGQRQPHAWVGGPQHGNMNPGQMPLLQHMLRFAGPGAVPMASGIHAGVPALPTLTARGVTHPSPPPPAALAPSTANIPTDPKEQARMLAAIQREIHANHASLASMTSPVYAAQVAELSAAALRGRGVAGSAAIAGAVVALPAGAGGGAAVAPSVGINAGATTAATVAGAGAASALVPATANAVAGASSAGASAAAAAGSAAAGPAGAPSSISTGIMVLPLPAAPAGPSASQLMSALRAAGVDTAALASAAQTGCAVISAGGANVGEVQRQAMATLASILRGRLEKRRNDDVVAEPWVQCDRCKGWVHQVCAMFNARKNALLPFNAEYICPLCRRDALQQQAIEEARAHGYGTRNRDKMPAVRAAAAGVSPGSSPSTLSSGKDQIVLPVVPTSSALAVSGTSANPNGMGALAVRTRHAIMIDAVKESGSAAAGSSSGNAGSKAAGGKASSAHGPASPQTSPRGTHHPSTASLAAAAAAASSSSATVAATTTTSAGLSHPHGHSHTISVGTVKYESAAVVNTAAALGVGSADVVDGAGGSSTTHPLPTPRSMASSDDGAGGGAGAGDAASSSAAASGPAVLSASADPYATSSALPHTPLSRELEMRVREKLKSEHHNMADVAASIVVRVVSSLKKSIAVPREVRTIFSTDPPAPDALVRTIAASDALSATAVESVTKQAIADGAGGPATPASAASRGMEYANEYSYRQRVILLWQRLDGVDVCLFALYVQEYGTDCPAPNRGKVYIAYLDSVRYLRPLTARTACYHELLAAYLANARHRGYDTCHIWACPPQRGDGYIFHCHPPSQRVPGKDRLREWYDEMLKPMEKEGTVTRINSLFDEYFEAVPNGSGAGGSGQPGSSAASVAGGSSAAASVVDGGGAGAGGGASQPASASASAPGSAASTPPTSPSVTGIVRNNIASAAAQLQLSSQPRGGAGVDGQQPKRLRLGSGHWAPKNDLALTTPALSLSSSVGGMQFPVSPIGDNSSSASVFGRALAEKADHASAAMDLADGGATGASSSSAAAAAVPSVVEAELLASSSVSSAGAGSSASFSTGAGAGNANRSKKAKGAGSRPGGTAGSSASANPSSTTAPQETILLKKGVGIPPYFAGDFWATEMERFIRDQHKKMVSRAARATLQTPMAGAPAAAGQVFPGPTPTASSAAAADPKSLHQQGGHAKKGKAASDNTTVGRLLAGAGITAASSAAGKGKAAVAAPPVPVAPASASAGGANTRKRGRDGSVAVASSSAVEAGGKKQAASASSAVGTASRPAVNTSSAALPAARALPPPLPTPSLASPASMSSQSTLVDYLARNPAFVHTSPNGLSTSIRVGDLSLPGHPIAALGARLKDMQREIFVVHLAPLRGRGRGATSYGAGGVIPLLPLSRVPGSDSTLSDGDHHQYQGSAASAGAPPDSIMEVDGEDDDDDVDDDGGGEAGNARRGSHGAGAVIDTSDVDASSDGEGALTTMPSSAAAASSSRSRARPGTKLQSTRAGADAGAGHRSSRGAASSAASETDDTDAEAMRATAATAASDAAEDERITCDFFDTRQGFLRMCQGNNYQFDTLRRAKHSSMMILWHLHNPSIPAYAHTCNVCETDIGCGTRWHCEACYDYDICDACNDNPSTNHPHTLVPKRDNNIVVQVGNGYVAAGGQLYQASPLKGAGAGASAASSSAAAGSININGSTLVPAKASSTTAGVSTRRR